MIRAFVLLVVFASVSRADDLDAIRPLPEGYEVVHTTYRNEILVADGLSIASTLGYYATMTNGSHEGSPMLLVMGIAGGQLATPIIHAIHGHGTRALGSYFLRGGLMAVGMIAAVESGGSLDCSQDSSCGLNRIPAGLAVGIAAATLFDVTYFSDDVELRPTRTWTPILAPQRGGAQIGFAASF
ncbi:MAG: hypothetical protein QM831_17225 [Kofleriaceae bacterium]